MLVVPPVEEPVQRNEDQNKPAEEEESWETDDEDDDGLFELPVSAFLLKVFPDELTTEDVKSFEDKTIEDVLGMKRKAFKVLSWIS